MDNNIKTIYKVTFGHLEVFISKIHSGVIALALLVEWNLDKVIHYYDGIGRAIVITLLVIGSILKFKLILKEYRKNEK